MQYKNHQVITKTTLLQNQKLIPIQIISTYCIPHTQLASTIYSENKNKRK